MVGRGWNTIALMGDVGRSLGGALSAIGQQRQRAEYMADQRRRQEEADKRQKEIFDAQMDQVRLSIPGATGEDVARNVQRRPDNPAMIQQQRQLPGGGTETRDIPASRLRQFGNVLDTQEDVQRRMMGPQPEFYSPEVKAQMEQGQIEKNARIAQQQFESSPRGQEMRSREKIAEMRLGPQAGQEQQKNLLTLFRSIGQQLQNMRSSTWGEPEKIEGYYELQEQYNALKKIIEQQLGIKEEPSTMGFLKSLIEPHGK